MLVEFGSFVQHADQTNNDLLLSFWSYRLEVFVLGGSVKELAVRFEGAVQTGREPPLKPSVCVEEGWGEKAVGDIEAPMSDGSQAVPGVTDHPYVFESAGTFPSFHEDPDARPVFPGTFHFEFGMFRDKLFMVSWASHRMFIIV